MKQKECAYETTKPNRWGLMYIAIEIGTIILIEKFTTYHRVSSQSSFGEV